MHLLPQALRLDSRLSRKILLGFTVTIVIPVILIAYLSLNKISDQLIQQSFDHSRHISKMVGMEIFRQLDLASEEMEKYITDIQSDNIGVLTRTVHNTPESRISSYQFFWPDSTDTNSGSNRNKPLLTDAARIHVHSGRTAITLDVTAKSKQVDILLVRTINNQNDINGLVVGRLNKAFLSSTSSILDEHSELVLTGPGGEILLDNTAVQEVLLAQLGRKLTRSISGHFAWDAGNGRQLTSFWSLFTREGFSLPFITISVTRPEESVLTTVSDFRQIYIPALTMAMVTVILLSTFRLKHLLKPIKTLSEATRSIAQGHFRVDIQIKGNDELTNLGDAFNSMSQKLERQFRSLSAIADIDTLILSSFDIDNIISAVLANAPTLTPCNSAALLILDENSSSGELFERPDINKETVTATDIKLTDNDIRILSSEEYLVADTGKNSLDLLTYMHSSENAYQLVFPLYIKNKFSAAIILGYATITDTTDEELTHLKKFADHVTVALNNSKWEERMYHQAHHDTLTGLPNRVMLNDRLDQALRRAKRNNCGMAVLFIDIDRFKLINDSLGHTAGDQLLVKIAHILSSSVRTTDTVVRFGGDEFVIVIPDMVIADDTWPSLANFANKIIDKASVELSISNNTIRSGISIGISTYPRDGHTTDELIKHADAAMYYAKKDGRARCKFFSSYINDEISQRVQIEQDLYRALENDQLFLTYQPKICCSNGRINGAETLIRWAHPEKGTIYPDDFIHIAEETGVINAIGEWAIETVCKQLASWSRSGLGVVPIAINISPRHFRERELYAYLQDILSSTDISPDLLELEVTEGAVMNDTDESIRKLNQLRDMGIKLSIDDFGTGFSSLGYLRSLPVDKLKIDQSFIRNMTDDKSTWAIVSSIIYLAHQLGLEVIAEGVETEAHLEIMRQLRCDTCQGFLTGKPVKAEEFRSYLTVMDSFQQNRSN